jgi:hypothetical protein
MNTQSEDTRSRLKEKMGDIERQENKNAVYPIKDNSSMCVVMTRTVNIKKGLLYCPAGMSKSDWLLILCKSIPPRRRSSEPNKRWFGLAVGFHSLAAECVHDYDSSADTCVCRPIPSVSDLFLNAFDCSFGSAHDRDVYNNRIQDVEEELKTVTHPLDKEILEDRLVEYKNMIIRMEKNPLILNDRDQKTWILDTVSMNVPSFMKMVTSLKFENNPGMIPLLIIKYNTAALHNPLLTGSPGLRSDFFSALDSLYLRLCALDT